MTVTTELVAWWGAIVATLVLVWDIVKWRAAGPKIRGTVKVGVCYPDGEVISTKQTPNGTETNLQSYCHIEVVNIGTQPTTLIGIEATHKKSKKYRINVTSEAFKGHFGKNLPIVLSPGEVWSGRLSMEHYDGLSQHGSPEIHLNLSHRMRPQVLKCRK